MDTTKHKWPDDADGDVLRRLEEKGFDFSKHYMVDFNIDFDQWPPIKEAMDVIRIAYPDAKIYGDGEEGYVLFKVNSLITYDFVVKTQAKASSLVTQYGGRCESWGVLHK